MTDAELVRQALEGRISSYEILVRRWSGRLTGYVRAKVRQTHVAEDLTQESFLRAYRSLATLSSPEKFGSWLLSIAHRLTLDWLKAKARTEIRFADLPSGNGSPTVDWSDSGATPQQRSERAEQTELLLREIDRLSEPLRQVVMIYYYDDVTYQDIADMLGVSVATVNARLTKARAALRHRLAADRREV